MNRLILVGNGFDLAHGLKTSYKDFIDDFWEEKINEFKYSESNLRYEDDYIIVYSVPKLYPPENNFKTYQDLIKHIPNIKIKNKFLELLSKKRTDLNWVDIENEYYNELNKVSDTGYSVDELNKDFEEIKKLLIDYLNKIDKSISKNKNIYNKIYDRYYIKDFDEKSQKKVMNFISLTLDKDLSSYENDGNTLSPETKDLKEKYLNYKNSVESLIDTSLFLKEKIDYLHTNSSREIFNLNINNYLFLNFNYTNSNKFYYYKYITKEVHIHGELNNKMNPIIFGFGDDVDKKYQEFEDKNDNRYLENFKSIAYLQTDNYKKLLEFIDSEEYQVFIFGHSCGISDRTMLNTIFEHDNCKSIKPFYHRKKNNNGNYIVDDFGNFIDNYTEIVQNISRNFNDKKKYRDRVVNKTYCEPLT